MSIYEAIKFLQSHGCVCWQKNDILVVNVSGENIKERSKNFRQISDELRSRGYNGPIQEA